MPVRQVPTGGRAAHPQPRCAVQCGAEAPYPTSRPTRSGEEELHVARSTTTLARTSGHRRATMRRLRVVAASISVLATAVVGACSAPPPVTPPPPVVPLVWPLTGVATAEVALRPAIAVKIENTSAARPQSGLESADVVWETIVEFDVSRLVAVFHSQMPAEIGPVRSVRPMDIPIINPLHGLFVYSGGQPGILALVYDSTAQPLSHDAGVDGLYRVSRRAAPHNVYGSLASFVAQADANHSAPPAQQFVFALRPTLASAVRVGTPATSLSFTLSSASHPSWGWDALDNVNDSEVAGVPTRTALARVG